MAWWCLRALCAALQNAPLPVYGTGQRTRCFTNVADVVHVLKLLIANEQAVGEIFNIGNTETITIEALASKIRDDEQPFGNYPYSLR